jgi:adenosylmethionine-8-amino-7-oxononanoate aminotransferase
LGEIPGVKEVRRVGLILGVEVEEGKAACARLREKGILTRPILNTVVLMPPLVIDEEELAFLVAGMRGL